MERTQPPRTTGRMALVRTTGQDSHRLELHVTPGEPSFAGARCLVLGAGGFVGGALAAQLCDRGADVHGFGHPPRHDADARVRWTTAEFSDATALALALRRQDIVFLLGPSMGDLAAPHAARAFAAHLTWTVRLLDACRAAGVGTVVFASSGGAVYGVAKEIPTPETARTEPISAYGLNRLTIEQHLELYRRLHGFDYRIVRIANCYGPGQSPLRREGFVAVALHRALCGEPLEVWGSDEIVRDFVYVDDVVRAIAHIASRPAPPYVVNVGSGEPRSLASVVNDIRALTGSALQVVAKPGRPVDVPLSLVDTTLIRAVTPWRPQVAWRDGLERTAAWLRRTYPP